MMKKTVSLKPVVETVDQDGVIMTPSKYPEALIAFTRIKTHDLCGMDPLGVCKRVADVCA